MAKVTWGGTALESALDDYDPDDNSGGYSEYMGERPPKGVYRFRVKMDKTESKGGFPQIIVRLTLDPDKPAHKQFKGYGCLDFVIVKDDGSTAFRVRPLLDALGVTSKQFRTATVTRATDRTGFNDEALEEIVKMGPVTVWDTHVHAYIRPDPKSPQYDRVRYISLDAVADSEEAEEPVDADAGDADDSEPPF